MCIRDRSYLPSFHNDTSGTFYDTFCSISHFGRKCQSFFLLFAKMRICGFSALVRGLQNLEAPFGKVLILFQRSRHCGELNRGLQNLEAFFKKGFNFVRAKVLFGWADSRFAKPRSSLQGSTDWYFLHRAKSTAKTRRGLRPSGLPGTIQISARYEILAEMTGHHQVTGRTKICSVAEYRRWGFESVRKGYLCADARLRSFEKGLFCCKLTVGFRGWNLVLHVSLGAVRNWSFAVLIKSFSLSEGFS